MTDNLKKFFEAISGSDKDYIDKVNKAKPEELIALAAEKGITLTMEDLAAPESEGEVSIDEAEAVAGGKRCVCVIGGGGEAGGKHDGLCACVDVGFGEDKRGNEHARCECHKTGYGENRNKQR